MIVVTSWSAQIVELILNKLLASLHALFGQLLLSCDLDTWCLRKWHVKVSLGLLKLLLLYTVVSLLLELLVLLIPLLKGSFSLFLSLFEFIQAMRLWAEHGYLLLYIAVGLNETVEYDCEIIIKLDLLLPEQLRYEPCLLDSKPSQLLQVIRKFWQSLTLTVVITILLLSWLKCTLLHLLLVLLRRLVVELSELIIRTAIICRFYSSCLW